MEITGDGPPPNRRAQVMKEHKTARGNLAGVLSGLGTVMVVALLFFAIQWIFGATVKEAGRIICFGGFGIIFAIFAGVMLWVAIEALIKQITTYIRTKNELKGWDDAEV